MRGTGSYKSRAVCKASWTPRACCFPSIGMRQAFTSSYFVINYSIVAQGLWGTETACQVVLSGVYDLDKWRGAGMPNCEVGKPALYP
jgi:hypothetical protein